MAHGFQDREVHPGTEVKNHRLASNQDISFFEQVVGTGVTAYLSEINAPLFVDEKKMYKPSKNSDVASRNVWEELGIIPSNYRRTDFATLIDGRIVLLTTFQKIEGVINNLPDKVAQIDFMFLEDWNSDHSTYDVYAKKKSRKEVGGTGLFNESLGFLRKVQRLAQAVTEDCILQISAPDEQRERIYKIALKGKPNVRFIHDASDIPYQKYSS